jgi:hypothetical protein
MKVLQDANKQFSNKKDYRILVLEDNLEVILYFYFF